MDQKVVQSCPSHPDPNISNPKFTNKKLKEITRKLKISDRKKKKNWLKRKPGPVPKRTTKQQGTPNKPREKLLLRKEPDSGAYQI